MEQARRIYVTPNNMAKLMAQFKVSRTTIDSALKWLVASSTCAASKEMYAAVRKEAKNTYEGKYLIEYEGVDIYILCTLREAFASDEDALEAVLRREKANVLKNKKSMKDEYV